MSKLNYFGRPWVVFDANNSEHREWYYEFQRTGTWGHCPVRFILAADSSNLVTQMQRELVQFYIQEEFA